MPRLADSFLACCLVFFAACLPCKAQLAMPLGHMKVNCGFGKRIHPVTGKADFHRGIDLFARSEPIYAILDGRVSAIGYNEILGNFIRLDHGDIESTYGHLSLVLASLGEELRAGDVIAVSGSTGRTTGEHLHFSLKLNGMYIDPIKFLTVIAGNL